MRKTMLAMAIGLAVALSGIVSMRGLSSMA